MHGVPDSYRESNHVHLIISPKENNVSSLPGDFKKHTSKQIIKAIKENPGESRREWMLKIFKDAGGQNSSPDSYRDGYRIINRK